GPRRSTGRPTGGSRHRRWCRTRSSRRQGQRAAPDATRSTHSGRCDDRVRTVRRRDRVRVEIEGGSGRSLVADEQLVVADLDQVAFVKCRRGSDGRSVDPNAGVALQVLDGPTAIGGREAGVSAGDVPLREGNGVTFLTPDRDGAITQGKDRGGALIVFNDQSKTHRPTRLGPGARSGQGVLSSAANSAISRLAR